MQANKLLGASYRLYYRALRNDTILRTVGYALPAAFHTHVKSFTPTTIFTSSRLLQHTAPFDVADERQPSLHAEFRFDVRFLSLNGVGYENAPGMQGNLSVQYTSALAYTVLPVRFAEKH